MPRASAKKSRQSTLKRWKTFNEKEILESYFQLDQKWGRKTINYVKDLVSLTEEQIYKWGYEKKRKIKVSMTPQNSNSSVQLSGINENFLAKTLDYNEIVSELFPESELNSEKLSAQERRRYDVLRDQMLQKDASIKSMSELDQILYERLPTKSESKMRTKSRKTSLDEGSTIMEPLARLEESRKCQEDPISSLVESSFEDSKISQAEERIFPDFGMRINEPLFMENNMNFGDIESNLFVEPILFKEDSHSQLFHM